jgi:hypothetical protein
MQCIDSSVKLHLLSSTQHLGWHFDVVIFIFAESKQWVAGWGQCMDSCQPAPVGLGKTS